jgi:hypothetical protein
MFDCPEARNTSPIRMFEREMVSKGEVKLMVCEVKEAFGV